MSKPPACFIKEWVNTEKKFQNGHPQNSIYFVLNILCMEENVSSAHSIK